MSTGWVDTQGDKDYADKRTYTTDAGEKYHVSRNPVTGFWNIHRDAGMVPKAMQGVFTDILVAQSRVEAHVRAEKIHREKGICPPLTAEERAIKPTKKDTSKDQTIFAAG